MLGSLNESMMTRLTSSVSGYDGYIRVGEGGRQRGGAGMIIKVRELWAEGGLLGGVSDDRQDGRREDVK